MEHVKNSARGVHNLSPHSSIMHCLSRPVDLGKVHQGVGRLIKVYVAYLKTLPRCVVMLSDVSEGGCGGGACEGNTVEKKKKVKRWKDTCGMSGSLC